MKPTSADDRQRHVQVEDLLDEALVGVERRVEEDQAKATAASIATVAIESGLSPLPYMLGEASERRPAAQSSSRKSNTA